MIYKDKQGKRLYIGDTVVYGHDNGSSLEVSTIVRLTPMFAWMKKGINGYESRRAYDRVIKLKGKGH